MPGILSILLTSSTFPWVAAATCQPLKKSPSSSQHKRPCNGSRTHILHWLYVLWQFRLCSLKVIHTRGVNVFSVSCRAVVNSWSNERQPPRAGSPPFSSPTTVEAPKHVGRWRGLSIPKHRGAAPTCQAAAGQHGPCAVRGVWQGALGSCTEKTAASWGFTAGFTWGPVQPGGTLSLTALAPGSSRKPLE